MPLEFKIKIYHANKKKKKTPLPQFKLPESSLKLAKTKHAATNFD